MSLILDALRKMELERKAKRQRSQEVRAEVLNYRGAAPAAEKSRTVPIMAALLLVAATSAAFFYVTKSDPPKIAPPLSEVLQQQAAPAIPPLPIASPPTEPSAHKESRREVQRGAEPAKPSAGTPTIKQNNGEAGLTVSGIAWQDERSLRRAVINGFLVGEGAEIQGAKIVEIKESRVRFSRGGQLFEVVHTSGMGN